MPVMQRLREPNGQIIQSSYNEVLLRDGFIVEAISSSVVETTALGYAFLEVTLFVRILSVISKNLLKLFQKIIPR